MGKIIDRVREREGRRTLRGRAQAIREAEEARLQAQAANMANHPYIAILDFCDWIESWWKRAFTTPSWMRKPDEPAAAIRNGGGE